MTENQSNYLADLAGRKGVRLEDVENVSAAWASAKIEELKALPDAQFEVVSDELSAQLNRRIAKTVGEVEKWTLTA